MYHKVEEFLHEWQMESESTIKVFKELTDNSLGVQVYNEGRSLGFIAWHIANTIGEMTSKCGLDVTHSEEINDEPKNVGQIINEYEKQSNQLIKSIREKWTDDMLFEEIELYGMKITRNMALVMLVKHEIHHRAQMTVLMRQAGLKVPGVYGPSKDEWSAMGVTALK